MNITIADQRVWLRSALRFYLEQLIDIGALIGTISEAADFDELLRLSERGTADLLLVEWELPGFRDQSAAENQFDRLRKSSPHLYIIAMSTQLDAKRNALAEGANSFISKTQPATYLLRELEIVKELMRAADGSAAVSSDKA